MATEPMSLIYLRLRDNTERVRRVRLTNAQVSELVDKLINNMDVREFSIGAEYHRHHKSYAEDFEPPPEGVDILEYLRKRNDLPLIDPANSVLTDCPE